MTIQEKMNKLLNDKIAKRSELQSNLVTAETVEERTAINDAITNIDSEIADTRSIIADLDAPKSDVVTENRGALNPMEAMGMRNGQVEDTAEARAQHFVDTSKTSMTANEARSVLLSTGSIAKPTGVGEIKDPFNVVSSIVDKVFVEDMTGMGGHKETYGVSWQSASAKTDGTALEGSDPTWKNCMINPFLMAVTTYVSRELRKQTPLQYETKVKQGALIALKKKLANWIVKGNGSTAAYGIYNAVNTDDSNNAIYDTVEMNAAIGATTLRDIVMAYGGDENFGAGTLILNKKDLTAFGDVRGDNEKKAIYEITPDGSNPNIGTIKDGGLIVPYIICSDVTSYTDATADATGVKTMIYGDLANYKLGLFGDFEIRTSEDYKFAEGLECVMGEVMVGGNVVADKGFVVVLKKTA